MAIYRVPFSISFTGAGSPGANVWHARSTGNFAPVDANLQSAVNAIRAFYVSCAGLMPSASKINIGTVTEEGTANEAVPNFAEVSGTGGVSSAPQALAIVVTWRTSVAARRGRGRTFLGPLATGAVQSDGTILDASATTVRSAATTLVAASQGFGNGAIGVWGLENPATGDNPDYPNLPHVLRDFTGSQVRDVFGILRSRRD